jgi:hypothetical protein
VSYGSFNELRASIVDTLDRPDLVDRVGDWVALCEARVNRVLRDRVIEIDFALSGEYVTLPANCAEVRSLRLNTSVYKRPITVMTREALAERQEVRYGLTGIPSAAAFTPPRTLWLSPAPSQTFNARLTYSARIGSLEQSDAAALALLQENPDLYLYGTLVHSAPFLKEDERLALWKGMADEIFTELETQLQRNVAGASLSRARLPRTF